MKKGLLVLIISTILTASLAYALARELDSLYVNVRVVDAEGGPHKACVYVWMSMPDGPKRCW